MPIDRSVATEQTVGADNARLNRFPGLHDLQQRDHTAQWKVAVADRSALLVEQDVRSERYRFEPGQDVLDFVSRKLAQNPVVYDVL
jgi:hypothetical protein